MGDGMGGFGAPQPIVTSSALGVMFVSTQELADLDDDGDLDLVASGTIPVGAIDVHPLSVLLNDGTAAFGPPNGVSTRGEVAEVTGDRFPDIVRPGFKSLPGSVGRPSSDPFAARVLPGDGAGGFGAGSTVGGGETTLLGVTQLDGMGPEDILVRAAPVFGAPARADFVLPSLGGGAFGPPIAMPSLPAPFEFVDLNGDGATDVVTAAGSSAIAFHLSRGTAAGSLDFGEVAVAGTAERPLTVTNDGAAPLTLRAAALAGPAAGDYAVLENACTDKVLTAGQSCVVRARFRPAAPGERSAQLEFAGAGEVHRVALSGVGLAVPGPAAGTPRCDAVPAAPEPGQGGAVRLSAGQLRINQRIGQAAVRRANALVARLRAGLPGEAFADGSITAADLAPGLPTLDSLTGTTTSP